MAYIMSKKEKISDLFNGIDNAFITVISETDTEDKKQLEKISGMSIDEIDDLNMVVKVGLEESKVPSKKNMSKIKKVLESIKKMEFNEDFTGDEDCVSSESLNWCLKGLAKLKK